jgi:hypothetical protein
MSAARKTRTAEQLRKLTDRQLFAWHNRMCREGTADERRLVFAELDRRSAATDFGRNPEWEGQAAPRRGGAR